jgi:hypothetical protein
MPPITDLTQITGEAAKIRWLHRGDQPNPFNVLLLGDGFTEDDEGKFENFIRKLTDRFFRIAPFSYCKSYINVLYRFLPSRERISSTPGEPKPVGVDVEEHLVPDPWRTVFRLCHNPADPNLLNLDIWSRSRVLNVVRRLTLPEDLSVPAALTRDASAIWLDKRSKSWGAVCVIANTLRLGARNYFTEPPVGTSVFDHRPDWRFSIMSMWSDTPFADDTGGGYEHVFAHEIAHSMNLWEEYQLADASGRAADLPAAVTSAGIYKNLEFIQDVDAVDLGTVKWAPLMTAPEREGVRNGTNIFTREKLIEAELIEENQAETAFKKPHMVNPTGTPVHWTQVYLVENAYYKNKIFKPNLECKMHNGVYYFPGNPGWTSRFFQREGARRVYGSPEFCRVCNYTIRERITGYKNYGVGGWSRLKLHTLFYIDVMKRLIRSFDIQNEKTGSAYAADKPFCEHASIRAYVMLRQRGIDVRLVLTPIHVCLYFQGVYLDPTFYDWYRVSGDEELKFLGRDGQLLPFTPHVNTQEGLAGDFEELVNTFHFFRPRSNSYILGRLAGEDVSTTAIVDRAYGLTHLWVGPDVDPELRQVDLTHPDIDNYVRVMMGVWRNWLEYRDNRTPALDYLRPLDMNL